MKFFFQYVAPVLAILWLAHAHPIWAFVAILLCLIRCAFKSRILSHMFAHFIYDVLKVLTLGVARILFHRRRD
jgi:hypothetical protein